MANPENLYSGREYFFLIINSVAYTTEEPINWGNVLIQMMRDTVMYGFTYEFIGGDVQLTFKWGDGGAELLEAQYDLYKGDAVAQLEFGILKSATKQRQFLGNINFNDYDKNDEGITVTVEKVAFQALLRTRMDVPISFNATTDLDGNTIPALPQQTIFLHSKEITKVAKADSIVLDALGQSQRATFAVDQLMVPMPPDLGASAVKYLQGDTSNIVENDLKIESLPMALMDTEPTVNSLFHYKAEEAGFIEITHNYNGQVYVQINFPPATTKNIVMTPYVFVKRAIGGAIDRYYDYTAAKQLTGIFTQNVAQNSKIGAFLNVDDEVYVGIVFNVAVAGDTWIDTTLYNWGNVIELRQLTSAPPSTAKGYNLFDAITRAVYIMTGRNNAVLSHLYSAGGDAERYFVTNGYAIRNFDTSSVTDAKPVQISLKDIIDGLQMLHNAGSGYGVDNAGNDLFVIDPCEKFFPDGVITELNNLYDYSEKELKANNYNEIELGYDKSPDAVITKNLQGGINTLDEMNTEQTWLTPIKTYKAKLSKKSKFITSGYMLEDIRREQFKTNPSTSMPSDDNFFLIAYRDELHYPNIQFHFIALDGTVTFSKPVSLQNGDTFTIAGATTNVGLFTIHNRTEKAGLTYRITPTPVNEASIGELRIIPIYSPGPVPGIVYAERNQFFNLDNVISPATVYNVRTTPKHAIYNWFPFLNSFLHAKAATQVLKNTISKNNGAFTSQFLLGAPAMMAAGNITLKENADIPMSDLKLQKAIHSGTLQTFKVQLPFTEIALIRDAVLNTTPPIKGYLVVPDKTGKKWLSALNWFKYNPTTETAEFECYKVEPY